MDPKLARICADELRIHIQGCEEGSCLGAFNRGGAHGAKPRSRPCSMTHHKPSHKPAVRKASVPAATFMPTAKHCRKTWRQATWRAEASFYEKAINCGRSPQEGGRLTLPKVAFKGRHCVHLSGCWRGRADAPGHVSGFGRARKVAYVPVSGRAFQERRRAGGNVQSRLPFPERVDVFRRTGCRAGAGSARQRDSRSPELPLTRAKRAGGRHAHPCEGLVRLPAAFPYMDAAVPLGATPPRSSA